MENNSLNYERLEGNKEGLSSVRVNDQYRIEFEEEFEDGKTIDELLAAVPSVDVNSEGEISLRGNADVLVWINGKKMGMNDDNRAQILRQLPAQAIESIEVMTNPSSKHSTEGIAGIINIRLKEDYRHGYFGNAEANVDTRGTANVNLNFNYNEGKFETFAGIGLKTQHVPGGSASRRSYDNGTYLNSDGDSKKHENSMFLRLGTNFRPDDRNDVYLSAIGTLGHKWGRTTTTHLSNVPGQWVGNVNNMRESGDTRGANVMLGYKHTFNSDHFIDMNVSYNIWRGPNDNQFHENETWADGTEESIWQSQHQDVKIRNWEAALDYSLQALPWDMTFQATDRYNSRRITAQGTLEPDWDVEAGVRKNIGSWGISLLCKDIFNSKETNNVLYGNGYSQSIRKWSGGRTLRLAATYTFGKSDSREHNRHNHIDTGGYGEEHH